MSFLNNFSEVVTLKLKLIWEMSESHSGYISLGFYILTGLCSWVDRVQKKQLRLEQKKEINIYRCQMFSIFLKYCTEAKGVMDTTQTWVSKQATEGKVPQRIKCPACGNVDRKDPDGPVPENEESYVQAVCLCFFSGKQSAMLN